MTAPRPTPRRINAVADTLASRFVVKAMPLYRQAIRDYLDGDTGSEAWNGLADLWGRQLLASMLLGRAATDRDLIRQRLIEAPTQPRVESLGFAQFDDDDIANRAIKQTAIDIINRFTAEIPDLATIGPQMAAQAQRQAHSLMMATHDDAPRLIGKIIERIPEAARIGPDTLPDPASIVRRLLDNDDGVKLLSRTLDTEARTSMMGGFNHAGRAEIVRHQNVMPVTILSEIQDRRTRGNPNGRYPDAPPHYQMDGFAAATDDPIWERITPPNGYNCRGSIRGVSTAKALQNKWLRDDGTVDREAMRRKFARQWRLIESGKYPDEGF